MKSDFRFFFMKLSESSRQKLELFFREHLNDRHFKLPKINFHAGKLSHFLTSTIKVDGIAFGKHIFIPPRLIERNSKNKLRINEELAAHEIAHALQYKREGFFGFLYKYLGSYRKNLRKKKKRDSIAKFEAYFEIPFEVEARETAEKFRVWNRKIK